LVQYDQQKISDLQNIQYQIVNYWQRKEILPAKLSDLEDTISGFKVPVDPQTGEKTYIRINYEYNIKDATTLSFELCTTFNKDSNFGSKSDIPAIPLSYYSGNGINENWQHSAGRYCFERTIDKQLYPPLKLVK
jgi:hypothetical protein